MNTVKLNGNDVSVEINGRSAKLYPHEGKVFLESRIDTEYGIKIRNNSSSRIEVVAAVDGLNVVTGKPAAVTDSGYVIPAWGSYTIKGFRNSKDEVGSFKFTEKRNSYAAEKGQASNTGVIAIAIYAEKYVPRTPEYTFGGNLYKGVINDVPSDIFNVSNNADFNTTCDWMSTEKSSTSTPTKGSGMLYSRSLTSNTKSSGGGCSASSYSHGTTWGKKVTDKVTETTFERAGNAHIQEFFYNSREKLEEMGVKLIHEAVINTPQGFPASFATPPKGWKK